MKLIDADNYCENICRCNYEECDKGQCPIHRAPTAYDVDKVVDYVRETLYQMGLDESQTEIIVDSIKAGGLNE